MQHIQPYPEISGDSADSIMARSGDVVGFSRSRVVWRFGFLPRSSLARAFNVDTGDRGFLFLLTTNAGRCLAEFWGFSSELPKRFRNIISSRPFALPTDETPDETTEETPDDGPCDGDYVISPCGPLGSRLSVAVMGGGKSFRREFAELGDAMRAIRENVEKEQFWPNVWLYSDHGNLSLVTDDLPESAEGNGRRAS